jgi:hypothetical protein
VRLYVGKKKRGMKRRVEGKGEKGGQKKKGKER